MTAQTARHRPDETIDPARMALVRGTPVSQGRFVGVARVLAGGGDLRNVEAGEVLVCANASPIILTAPFGALVADAGGVLSNPAITARERGIPAVFATRDGTKRIRDGQRVAVDGDRGVVTILS